MNSYIKKLIHINNNNQREVVPEHLRKDDWRYQIMELPEADLEQELSTWSRDKLIYWLDWNDPNGVWTDEDAIAEGYAPLNVVEAKNYVVKLLIEDR